MLTIDDIVANGKSLVTGEAPQVKETPVEEEETPTLETSETTAAEEQTATAEAEDGKKTRRRRSAKAENAESSTEE